jgi:hypothetical protein
MTGQARCLPRVSAPLRVAVLVAAAILMARLPAAAQAGDDSGQAPWIYPLADGSALTIQVPSGWDERTSAGAPGQVHFSAGGSRCEVQIAIRLVTGSDPPLDDPDAVRALVDADARDYLDRAVEGHYNLRELRGPEAVGWYFALRQREPAHKGSAFVNRGAVKVGTVVLSFSIETPKPDLPEVRQALKMLAESREMKAAPARVPAPAHPETATAKPPSLVSLNNGVSLQPDPPPGPLAAERPAVSSPDPSSNLAAADPPPSAPPSSAGSPKSRAEPSSDAPASSGAPPVSAVAAVLTLAPGARGEARLILAIQKGMRILAHDETGKYMQPAMLSVEAANDVFPETAVFPAGTTWKLQPDDPDYKTYEGTVVVRLPVRARAGTAPGSRVLKGHLRYQAIETGGRFAKTAVLPVTIPVTVGKSPAEK